MDYVPSMAAVAAASQKTPHDDAIALTAAKAVAPVAQTALDPRSIYTFAPGTADAMLSLADLKTQAVSAADFDTRYVHATHITEAATAVATAPVVSPEPTKAISASNRNWNEDVRLDHIPTRKVGADTVVQYDTPRVMAAWSAAFPDIAERKFRGLTPADTNIKPEKRKATTHPGATLVPNDIYLLCSTDNYKIFSETHPHTHVNWIPVENEEIFLFWPKDQDGEEGHEARGDSRSSEGKHEGLIRANLQSRQDRFDMSGESACQRRGMALLDPEGDADPYERRQSAGGRQDPQVGGDGGTGQYGNRLARTRDGEQTGQAPTRVGDAVAAPGAIKGGEGRAMIERVGVAQRQWHGIGPGCCLVAGNHPNQSLTPQERAFGGERNRHESEVEAAAIELCLKAGR